MDNTETGRVIDDLIGNAKNNYEYQQWLKSLEDVCRKLDSPALIQNNSDAINAVALILEMGIDKNGNPFAPILHRLGMKLVDYLTQGTKEGITLSGTYYASETSYEFTGNNFTGFIGSIPVVWGTFTVSGNGLNLHITGDLDGEKSAFITFTIIDANTIADIGGSFYRRR